MRARSAASALESYVVNWGSRKGQLRGFGAFGGSLLGVSLRVSSPVERTCLEVDIAVLSEVPVEPAGKVRPRCTGFYGEIANIFYGKQG
jgi:hypothetical protein